MIASQELERKQFFQPVVEAISLTLGLPACIWLADKEGKTLSVAAAEGLEDDYVREASLRLDEPSVASDVFATGQTIAVTEIASDDRWQYKPEAADMGLKSAIVVPLRVKNKIVGVLDVYTHEVRDFSASEKSLIESFAAQVAVTQRRIRDLAVMNEVSLLISSELRPADLFKRIMQAAERVLDCKHVSVFLADKTGDLVLKATSSAGIARERFAPGEGLAGWVAQTKQSELVPDAFKHPRFASGLSSELVERSMVLAPIILEDRAIGVISADMDGLSGFDEHDRMLLDALAGQAAVAVRNARLFEQRQTLNEVGKLLMEKRDVHEILRLLMQKTLDLFNVDQGSFWSVDHAHHCADLRFSVDQQGNLSDWYQKEAGASVPLEQNSIVGNVAATELSELWNDVYQCPHWNPKFDRETGYATKRVLAVPILRGQRATGVIQVVNPVDDSDFTGDDQEFLMSITSMAAIALHNAEMHEREMALSDIGRTLTAGSHLHEQEILELIYQQAGRLMDTDNMYIALYDEATDTVRFGLAFVDGRRINVEMEKGWQPRRAGKGKTEEIVHTGEPLFHATKAEAEKWYAQPGHEEYIGEPFASWLGVPMMVGEKVLGVVATYNPIRDYVYSSDDLEILQAMANQAAVALDNAHMFYNVNRRLEALVEFGQEVTFGIRREDQVLRLIHNQASKLMDTDNMYIALYDEVPDTVRFGLAFVDGKPVDVETEEGWQPRRAGKGKTEEIIRTRKSLFHATKVEAEKWYARPGHEEYVGAALPSWLGVPMIVGEKVLGVIATYHPTREYVYSGDDLGILQAMAKMAAIALDNARLYEETRELQDEVVAAKQLATLGTAMAALRHRINNTFNIIVPNVTRLRKRVDLTNETIVDILDIIERNARLTSDIIARIQEPLREIEVQDVDVNAVLDEVLSTTSEQWPGINIMPDLDDSIPLIRAPIGQITEVFRNLVDNACRVMKKSGWLTVASRLTGDTINVRVQDTGPGIPPRIQRRLFVKPVPSKAPGGGAGLGLWLSQLMLQSIGGSVTIEHSDPTGTTMLVQIPTPGAGKKEVLL